MVKIFRTFPYIFWEADSAEGSQDYLFQLMKEGFYCFSKEEVLDKIDTLLKLKGLNVTERNDLITYWIQDLTSKKYCMISFINQELYNNFAQIEITPKPTQVERVIMLLKPIDTFETPLLKVEDQKQVERSNEPLVIEWGGMKLN